MELIREAPMGTDFWDWLYTYDTKLPSALRITTDELPADEYDSDPDEIDAHCRELNRTRGIDPPDEYREFLANIRVIGGYIGRRFPLDEITPPENVTDVFCGIWRLQLDNLDLKPESVNPLVPLFDLGEEGLYCLYLGKTSENGNYPVIHLSHSIGCRFGVVSSGIKRFLAANLVKTTLETSYNSLTPLEISRRIAQTDPCCETYFRLYRALCDTGDQEGAATALNAAKSADYKLEHPAACNIEEWSALRGYYVIA